MHVLSIKFLDVINVVYYVDLPCSIMRMFDCCSISCGSVIGPILYFTLQKYVPECSKLASGICRNTAMCTDNGKLTASNLIHCHVHAHNIVHAHTSDSLVIIQYVLLALCVTPSCACNHYHTSRHASSVNKPPKDATVLIMLTSIALSLTWSSKWNMEYTASISSTVLFTTAVVLQSFMAASLEEYSFWKDIWHVPFWACFLVQ